MRSPLVLRLLLAAALCLLVAVCAEAQSITVEVPVPASGISLIGQVYRNDTRVQLINQLDPGATIVIRDCKFLGTATLVIHNTFQRGVSLTIEGNTFDSGGISVAPLVNGTGPCLASSRTGRNADLINVVIRNNVISGANYLVYGPRCAIGVAFLLLCSLDRNAPDAATTPFSGVNIVVENNDISYMKDETIDSFNGVWIYPEAVSVFNQHNASDPTYARLQYITFARINDLRITNNKIRRHNGLVVMQPNAVPVVKAESYGIAIGLVSYGHLPNSRRCIIRPALTDAVNPQAGPALRRFVIEDNVISLVDGASGGVYIGELSAQIRYDAGYYRSVALELSIGKNTITVSGTRGSTGVHVRTRLPLLLRNDTFWMTPDGVQGAPALRRNVSFAPDSPDWLFSRVRVDIVDTHITLDLAKAPPGFFIFALGNAISIGLLGCAFQDYALTLSRINYRYLGAVSSALLSMEGFVGGRIVVTDCSIVFDTEKNKRRDGRVDRLAGWSGVHFHFTDGDMLLLPYPFRMIPLMRIQRVSLTVIDTYYDRGVSLLVAGSIHGMIEVEIDRCMVFDSMKIQPDAGGTSATLLHAHNAGPVRNYTLTNNYIESSARSVRLYTWAATGPIGTITVQNATLRALCAYPTTEQFSMCFPLEFGNAVVTGSVIVRAVHATCHIYATSYFATGPKNTPLLRITDTVFDVRAAAAWVLALDPRPISTVNPNCYLPRIELISCKFTIHAASGIGALISAGSFTAKNDAFSMYSPIDPVKLNLPPMIAERLTTIQRPISLLSFNIINETQFVTETIPLRSWGSNNTVTNSDDPSLRRVPWDLSSTSVAATEGRKADAMWLLRSIEADIRSVQFAAVFFLTTNQFPRLVFSAKNRLKTQLWAKGDPANAFGDDTYGTEVQQMQILATALGVDFKITKQARLFSCSYAKLSDLVLGERGVPGCSYYNGRKISNHLVTNQLEGFPIDGILQVMYGDGVLKAGVDFNVSENGCVHTPTRTAPRTPSDTQSLSLSNETATPAPTRTRTASATKAPLPPYGLSAQEQRATSAVASLGAVGSLLGGPTAALDVGVAMSLLSLVSLCQQFSAAQHLVPDGQRRELERSYARGHLTRSVAFPESWFGICLGERNVCAVRGAVLGGLLMLALVALASLANGFRVARQQLRMEALQRWKERQRRLKKQQQEQPRSPRSNSKSKEASRRWSLFSGGSGVERDGSGRRSSATAHDDDDEKHSSDSDSVLSDEDAMQRRRQQEDEVMATVAVTPMDAVRFARLPWALTLVSAMQLAAWIGNSVSLVVAPANAVPEVSTADKVFGGFVVVACWLLPALFFCIFLQLRGLSRCFDESSSSPSSSLSSRARQRQQQAAGRRKSNAASCFAPMTRDDALSLFPVVLWSRHDYDGSDGGVEYAADWRLRLLHLMRSNKRVRWLLAPQFVWSMGPRGAAALGELGSFLRQVGTSVTKFHGPHSWALVRQQQKHEERGDGADGTASSGCMSLLQTKLSPFTVYVSSVFVVVAAAAQAVAALHPRSCVACLAVVSSSQFLALAWTALLRPALLAPVNVLVALSHLCVFIASVAATAVIGMSSGGGASSAEAVAAAEGAVSASKGLLYCAVVVTNLNVFLNGVVRLLTIVLGVWTVATETEAATTLDAAERKRRRQLRRAAGGEHGNGGNKFGGGSGGDGDETLLTSSLKRRRESIATMVAQARQPESPRSIDERGHSQRRASPFALTPTGPRRRASDPDHDAVEMRASPRRFTPTPRSSPILRPQPHLRGGRATDSDLDDDFLLRRGSGAHRHSDNRRVSPRRNPPHPPSPHQPLPPSARQRAQPKPAEEGRNKFAFALPKFSFDLL